MVERIKSVPAGTVIYEQGAPCHSMYVIRSGKVGLYLDYETPHRFALHELSVGMALGEMGLLEEEPRNATAVALTHVELQELSLEEFPDFLAEHPKEAENIIISLSHRLKSVMVELMNAHQMIRDCIEEIGENPVKKATLGERLKKYADLFLDVPKDIPPDLYLNCYFRYHGNFL